MLHLLDDDTPEVRAVVSQKLIEYGGDVSEALAEYDDTLSDKDVHLLSRLLLPARREQIIREWTVPQDGLLGMLDDWEFLEAQLRIISDYLHDGVTLRPSLHDMLDLVAEEARPVTDEAGIDGLRIFLFESGKFKGNHENYNHPCNSDLCWSIQKGKSNPLGLCTIFILVARRLNLEVDGVNFPNHFICCTELDGKKFLIDCFNGGKIHDLAPLLEKRDEMAPHVWDALHNAATPGEILLRTLRNMELSFTRHNATQDANLMKKLIASLNS